MVGKGKHPLGTPSELGADLFVKELSPLCSLYLNHQGKDGIVDIVRIPRAEGLRILKEMRFGAQDLPWTLREH